MTYALDITNLSEEQRGDVSQRLHELQETCLDVITAPQGKAVGIVEGNMPFLTAEILQSKGYNVTVYSGCGHCLQGMAHDGGRCDCECHS